jgi:hypothetical protein
MDSPESSQQQAPNSQPPAPAEVLMPALPPVEAAPSNHPSKVHPSTSVIQQARELFDMIKNEKHQLA